MAIKHRLSKSNFVNAKKVKSQRKMMLRSTILSDQWSNLIKKLMNYPPKLYRDKASALLGLTATKFAEIRLIMKPGLARIHRKCQYNNLIVNVYFSQSFIFCLKTRHALKSSKSQRRTLLRLQKVIQLIPRL